MTVFSPIRRTALPLCLALVCLLGSLPLQAGLFDGWQKGDGLPEPPDPPRLVNDLAGVLPSFQRDSLERVLVDFDRNTSNQICVVTVSTLGDREIMEYGTALGNKWGIGSTRNNGVLLLLKARGTGDERYIDVAIMTGRGLEGAIPDAYASRIIRNIMGPELREDRYMPAVAKACAELMALAAGEISEPRDDEEEDMTETIVFVIILLILILLIVFGRSGRNNGKGGSSGGSRGGGGPVIFFPGGGRSSGGSFSGGFGGGFGGFGGGSFGGGGAHGRF